MAAAASNISFLNQQQAQALDVDMMSPEHGFSLDQLMELAGLSVAAVIQKQYPLPTFRKVLVVCGPGNNGGDGLVASRHLVHFGYAPTIIYPKQGKNEIYKNLIRQNQCLKVPILEGLPDGFSKQFDVVLDGIFGFSFSGDVREPFGKILKDLNASGLPIAAIDVPSGWDVEKGNASGVGLKADTLISLTAPKLCAKYFNGKAHYLGGRFVPPAIIEKYGLVLPEYPGAEQCTLLPNQPGPAAL